MPLTTFWVPLFADIFRVFAFLDLLNTDFVLGAGSSSIACFPLATRFPTQTTLRFSPGTDCTMLAFLLKM